MRIPSIAAAILALALPAAALADPSGTFDLRGINPDNRQEYTGTVRVTRTGETYRVVWTISNQEINGIGVGLKLIDGKVVMGPASEDDAGISIAYSSGGSYGTVVYFEQPDGRWHGIWAYEGQDRISTEDWFPRNKTVVVNKDEKADKEIKSFKTEGELSAPMPIQAGPKN
jgi:hypothetical protein